jgi:hypothetical protein
MSSQLDRIQQRYQQIKSFYLRSQTAGEWQAVSQNPALFNRVWCAMLGLPASDMPPSSSLVK